MNFAPQTGEKVFPKTTLSKLEFGGIILNYEPQFNQFADRLTPEPFAHPTMDPR